MRCTLLITGYSFCGAMAGAEEGRFIWCSCTLLVAGCSFYGAMAGAEEGRFIWCSCTLLVAGCWLLVLRCDGRCRSRKVYLVYVVYVVAGGTCSLLLVAGSTIRLLNDTNVGTIFIIQ